jgi:CheY-like chemotaxis protein
LPVHADASRLEQAISNVLNNASKYTPQGGRIEVQVTADGDCASIAIRDTGDGIAQEDLPHLFQLFGRGSAVHTRSEGLGVGLYIAHELVGAHGGTVVARSAGVGRGSEFVIRLPLAPPATALPAIREPVAAPVAASLRILVVDDNRDAADALAQMLAQAGHEVDVCYEGKAALRLARERQPDVALIDIGLPTISGYDVARDLAGNGSAPVMVAVTGWGAQEDKAKAFAAGFARHLTKPIDVDLLLVLLGDIARLRNRA